MLKNILRKLFDALPFGVKTKRFFYLALKFPQYIGQCVRSNKGYDIYYKVVCKLNSNELKARRFPDGLRSGQAVTIPEEDGYLIQSLSAHPKVADAISYCRSLMESLDFVEMESKAKKSFLIPYSFSLDNPSHKPIFDLAIDPVLVEPVSDYLKVVPILHAAHLMYSPNKSFVAGRSQEYHRDGPDFIQMKVWVILDEIDEDAGPFTLIPGKCSEEIFRNLASQGRGSLQNVKYNDEEIYSVVSDIPAVSLIGPTGTVGFTDTSRCFHYGSRPAKRPRKMLLLEYTRPFCTEFPIWGRRPREVVRDNGSQEQSMLGNLVLGLNHQSYNNMQAEM